MKIERSTMRRVVGAACVGAAAVLACTAAASNAATSTMLMQSSSDMLIMKSGQIVEGTFVSETDTHVVFKVRVGGIEAEATYAKADILKVERGIPKEEAPKETKPSVTRATTTADPGGNVKSVYVMELKGWFPTDISQTPIKEALRDARRMQPDYLIVVMNNDWSLYEGLQELTDDTMINLQDMMRAGDIAPMFFRDIPREWEKKPEIVFWIKNAMGGGAFVPLSCPNIYFHSRGKMGGLGGLDIYYGSFGDEVVRQKMYSLFGATARGMAIQGGYDPKIVNAMMLLEYELSYSMDGDRPVFHERLPEPGEFLLTDNGRLETHADNVRQRVTGEGNDVLTLRADLAEKLKVSKGTVDTLDDLLYRLGIARNHQILNGRAEAILSQWRQGVAMYGRDLRRMWQEFEEIQVEPPGEYRERTQARGRQQRKLDEIIRLIEKFEECLDPRAEGVPDKNTLEIIKKRIQLEQMQDRR